MKEMKHGEPDHNGFSNGDGGMALFVAFPHIKGAGDSY
jgi:hypothetical protein